MRRALIVLNLLLLAALVVASIAWEPMADSTPMPGTQASRMAEEGAPLRVADVALAAAPAGGDFILDGPQGKTALHDFAGRVVLLQFGYTYCPDICPTALTILADAMDRLSPAERAQVQPLFVSVDPQRDSVARLREYTQFFHPAIIGLTGAPETLAAVAARYGAVFVRHDEASAGGAVIDHTALTYLIDRRGQWVASLPHATPADMLLGKIRTQLANP